MSSLNTKLAADDQQHGAETSVLVAKEAGAKMAGSEKIDPTKVNLPGVITQYQQSWYKRLSNVGGGNSGPEGVAMKSSELATGMNWAGTLMSGGILGSYGLSKDAGLNKQIDDIVAAKTKIDYNATFKLTDVFTRSSDKLENLSTKISVCEQLEGDIGEYIEKNKRSIELMENMRNTISPGLIGRMREGIANAWEKSKDAAQRNPGTSVAVGAAMTAGVVAAGPMNVAGAVASGAVAGVSGVASGTAALAGYAGSGLYALGAAAIANPLVAIPVGTAAIIAAGIGIHKIIKDRNALHANMDMLQKMRESTASIRVKTEEARDAILEKIKGRYGPELQVEKDMRELIRLRSEGHPELVEQFEMALQDADPKAALKKFMADVTKLNPPIFHNALEIAHMQRYCDTLGNRRAMNLRDNTRVLVGDKNVTGPEAISRLVKRLQQVNSLTGVRGKKVKLTGVAGLSAVDATISDMYEEGGETVLILSDAVNHAHKTALRIKQKDGKSEVTLTNPMVNLSELRADLDAHEADVKPEFAEKSKALILAAKSKFLDLAQYETLKNYFKKIPATLKSIVDGKGPFTDTKLDDKSHITLPPLAPVAS